VLLLPDGAGGTTQRELLLFGRPDGVAIRRLVAQVQGVTHTQRRRSSRPSVSTPCGRNRAGPNPVGALACSAHLAIGVDRAHLDRIQQRPCGMDAMTARDARDKAP
jgi:hypothetical protein